MRVLLALLDNGGRPTVHCDDLQIDQDAGDPRLDSGYEELRTTSGKYVASGHHIRP